MPESAGPVHSPSARLSAREAASYSRRPVRGPALGPQRLEDGQVQFLRGELHQIAGGRVSRGCAVPVTPAASPVSANRALRSWDTYT